MYSFQKIMKIAQKKQEEIKGMTVKRLEEDIAGLRKTNTNPVFQQYINISEENAKLNKELNLLKYKYTELQEERDILEHKNKEEIESKKVLSLQNARLLKDHDFLENVFFELFLLI